jgi:hypothetical protein
MLFLYISITKITCLYYYKLQLRLINYIFFVKGMCGSLTNECAKVSGKNITIVR